MDGEDEPMVAAAMAEEPHVERLPADLLAHTLSLLPTFHDLAMAGGVSRRWRRAVGRSLATRRRLSFAGQRTGDDSTARLVRAAVNLRDLDISRSCWGCHITDKGLLDISSAACVGNLTSVSLWGLAGITDEGVVHLVSRARSLQHLNIGGTFITDETLYAVANSCANLKHHTVELPPRDRGWAAGAGEQVSGTRMHQCRWHAGVTGELRRPALDQSFPPHQVYPPDPQRRSRSSRVSELRGTAKMVTC